MVWSRKIENIIYNIFYQYDIHGLKEQQEKLKSLCIQELNAHPEIKQEIKTDKQLEYFVMQVALENVK